MENKLEQFNTYLENSQFAYKCGDLKETVDLLDKLMEIILEDEKNYEDDTFWKYSVGDVFKSVVLNAFYNHIEINYESLSSIFEKEEEVKQNLESFSQCFKSNDSLDFLDRITNISENVLKSDIKIINDNLPKLSK